MNFDGVEAELLGVALELLALQRVLVREQLLVHLPELALVVRSSTRPRAAIASVVVEGQRVLLEHDAHVVAVRLDDLLDRAFDAAAERALEVAELHDRHERVRGALDRRVADGNFVDGLGIRLLARLLRRCCVGLGAALLGERVLASARRRRPSWRRRSCIKLVGALELVVDDLLELVDRLRTATGSDR